MSDKLPACSAGDVIKALKKIGYEFDHQTGSHMILRKNNGRRVTVPNHRELAKGTLRSIIRETGLTKEEFVDLLG